MGSRGKDAPLIGGARRIVFFVAILAVLPIKTGEQCVGQSVLISFGREFVLVTFEDQCFVW